jgi:streptogramin lyase
MATLNQVRTKVDDWLALKWPTVKSRQQTYFDNHGRYWQGLITHSSVPVFTTNSDGDAIPDDLSFKPTDGLLSWEDIFPDWEGALLPCAIKIDVYDGPQGMGYVGVVFVRYNGTVYSRSQNVGPESSRTKAWHIVEES